MVLADKACLSRAAYGQRNTVERCINKIKQWRGLATCYDKAAAIYLAALHIAAIFIWVAGRSGRNAPVL